MQVKARMRYHLSSWTGYYRKDKRKMLATQRRKENSNLLQRILCQQGAGAEVGQLG